MSHLSSGSAYTGKEDVERSRLCDDVPLCFLGAPELARFMEITPITTMVYGHDTAKRITRVR